MLGTLTDGEGETHESIPKTLNILQEFSIVILGVVVALVAANVGNEAYHHLVDCRFWARASLFTASLSSSF